MKLLLINPFFGGEVTSYPPLELGFIGTYIKDHSTYEVEIVDPIAQALTEKEVLNKVKKADIVGLTCFTERRFQCFDFAKKCKEVNPSAKLVIGGPHATSLDIPILEHCLFVDLVVRGEGEETLLEIIKRKPLESIRGITWRKNGRIIRNPDRELFSNIDSLYIDYSLLPLMDKYGKDYAAPFKYSKLRQLYILATRGCPYYCRFCGGPFLWHGVWRAPAVQTLITRMEELANQYSIEYFRFCDGNFTANETWVIDFCDELHKRRLNIYFGVDSRVNISEKVLCKLAQNGCVRITFGIESGSDRVLKSIDKDITVETAIKTIKRSKECGIWTRGDFIFFWPGEREQDFEKTLQLIKEVDEPEIHLLHLLPGTSLYEELKQRGEINDKIWFDSRYSSPKSFLHYCKENFASASFDLGELERLKKHAYYVHTLHRPLAKIKKEGIFKGTVHISLAGLDILLMGRASKLASLLFRVLLNNFG